LSQEIRIDEAARKQQGVVIVRISFVYGLRNFYPASGFMQIDPTNLAAPQRDDVHPGAGTPVSPHREGQLDFFETISNQCRDAAVSQFCIALHRDFLPNAANSVLKELRAGS
jgi:hypothetical protein